MLCPLVSYTASFSAFPDAKTLPRSRRLRHSAAVLVYYYAVAVQFPAFPVGLTHQTAQITPGSFAAID